jgi:hypothetical protein
LGQLWWSAPASRGYYLVKIGGKIGYISTTLAIKHGIPLRDGVIIRKMARYEMQPGGTVC